MGAGSYNRRVEILRRSEVDDGAGGKILTWARLAWRRASAKPTRLDRLDVADLPVKQQAWRMEMRPTDITKEDRIRFDGVEHLIRSLGDPDGTRMKLVLIVEEVGAAS